MATRSSPTIYGILLFRLLIRISSIA